MTKQKPYADTVKHIPIYMYKAIVGACMLAGIMVPPPIHAASSSLRVSPVIIDLPLQPGTIKTQTISLENLSSEPLAIQVDKESFTSDSDEAGDSTADNPSTPSLLEWISVTPENILFNPNETKTVSVTISVPSKVDLGGYYAMIFLTPLGSSRSPLPIVKSRIGIIVMGSVGVMDDRSAEKTGLIRYFSFPKVFFDRDLPRYTLSVRNISLSHISAKPMLTIREAFGRKSYTMDVPEKIIFPGKSRIWKETINKTLPPNMYNVIMSVSLGSGRIITRNTYIIVGPWKTAGGVLLTITLVVLLITKRKNIAKAVMELGKRS